MRYFMNYRPLWDANCTGSIFLMDELNHFINVNNLFDWLFKCLKKHFLHSEFFFKHLISQFKQEARSVSRNSMFARFHLDKYLLANSLHLQKKKTRLKKRNWLLDWINETLLSQHNHKISPRWRSFSSIWSITFFSLVSFWGKRHLIGNCMAISTLKAQKLSSQENGSRICINSTKTTQFYSSRSSEKSWQ